MKLNTLNGLLVLGGIALGASSCQKEETGAINNTPINTSFKYETRVKSGVTINAPKYLSNATFELYTTAPEKGGSLIAHGQLDANGKFRTDYTLPSSLKKLYLKSTYVGLSDLEAEITNGQVNFDYISLKKQSASRRSSATPSPIISNGITYEFMGGFNNQGVPNYLTIPDPIDASLISTVNASLPESQAVPTTNPTYLNPINQTDLALTTAGDVWITFIHEGAGALNSFGFYTYDKHNPPQTISDIGKIKIILPNASAAGSGGGLVAGDKIYLGNYPANTGFGWVIFQNAWNGSGINVNATKFFSNGSFNPEHIASKKQHVVQLVDNNRQMILVGIEDVLRTSNSDEDFNDLVFYLTADPWSAVDKDNIPGVKDNNKDTDGDGVPDYVDDYPNDKDKAFDNYMPFKGEFTSYAFEDLWPNKGDFDFNDLIININYNHITNAQHKITEMVYRMKVEHIGASYKNGFGIEWPFPAAHIKSISGIQYPYNNIASNGTELNQDKAVMIAYPNVFDAQYKGIMEVTIKMETPFSLAELTQQGLNPFIYIDQDRKRELHLMDKEPTKLAKDLGIASLYGSGNDASNTNTNKYFRTKQNEPWAIAVSHAYRAPGEKFEIWKGYLKFNDWVNSNGTNYTDWYENKAGYRNNAYIQ